MIATVRVASTRARLFAVALLTVVAFVAGGALAPAAAEAATARPPAGSGTGKRVVYDQSARHVWLVDADNRVVRHFPVTGRIGKPLPGRYRVFSQSLRAFTPNRQLRWRYMTRFAWGRSLAIGFHAIPTNTDGVPIQRVSDLGKPGFRSGGCVRMKASNARFLYYWARVGTRVVVLR